MKLALTPLALVVAVATASAQSMSTGAAPWQTVAVLSNGPGSVNCRPGGAVQTVTNPPVPWVAAPAGSSWVSCNAADGDGGTTPFNVEGIYTYRLDLNALAAGGGTFSFRFAGDNNIAFSFGSGISGITGTTSCLVTTCFSGLSGLVTGSFGASNAVVTATVTNVAVFGLNPTGFLVSGSVVAAPVNVVPEPGTYALMATGLATLAGVARRRRASA